MRRNFEFKSKLIGLLFVILATICISRLYFLQVVHGNTYRARSDGDIYRPNQVVFDRGTIYWTQKSGSLFTAGTVASGYTLAVNSRLLTDSKSAFLKLSPYIKMSEQTFLNKVADKNDPYEEIERRVNEADSTLISNLDIPGIILQREQWRVYPGERSGAHVLGFAGHSSSGIEGRYGLERYYDDNLKREGIAPTSNFFVEIFSDAEKLRKGGDELEGDIISTIEPTVQATLEGEIKKVHIEFGSKETGGIVMDPVTGEIYAMASYPTFDPNKYGDEKNLAVFSNPLTEKVYEMGSIIKPLTMSAGIDTGLFTASTTYKDEGFLKVGNRTIYNFDKKGRGVVPMQEVLSQSLNTGVATVALKIGKKRFEQYITAFGLGEETGIDLPSEAGGLLRNLLKGGEVELANASFGQGIAVTPIAVTRALSALGNGGLLPNPHLVKEIDYKLGFSKKIVSTPEEMRRVIKPKTSEEITKMLVQVVDKALKNGALKMEHYSIAAKTGTAQIANKEDGGYYADRYLHSFFGYFPAYNPKFIVFLYTLEPKADYASNTLTTPFKNMSKFLLNYYQIPPDR